jgi:hypothetical protein
MSRYSEGAIMKKRKRATERGTLSLVHPTSETKAANALALPGSGNERFRKDMVNQINQLHKAVSKVQAQGKSIHPITSREADILARLVSRLKGEEGDYSRR